MSSTTEPFMWAVRALAQPADVQVKLFPAFVDPPFELLTEFEETFRPDLAAEATHRWTGEQLVRLTALDEQLKAMANANEDEVWDDENCLEHAEWEKARKLAREILAVFNWPAGKPHTHDL